MITQILHDVKMFNGQISHLRSVAPIHPETYYEEKGNVVWGTTMVIFEYEGVKYKRHHVESVITHGVDDATLIKNMKLRLVESAFKTIEFGKPYKGDEVV